MARGVSLTFNLYGRDATASKALKGVGTEAGRTHSRFGGMAKAGALAASGVAAVGVAAGVAGKMLFDATKAAASDEAAQKRLARELRNSTGATAGQVAATEDWITAQGKALGVADDKLRPALARLARSTKDTGEAQDLARLAMDVSAGTGKDLEQVAMALGRAHDGNTGALGRLGLATKDAQGKALSFEQITKNMAKTFKGQASEGANTLEGKMGRLRLMFDETKESIGAKFLPVAEKLGDWIFTKGIPALEDLGRKVMPVVQEAWEGIKQAFEDARPGLEVLGKALIGVGKVIAEKVVPIVVKLYGVYWRNLLKALGKLGEILPDVGIVILRFAGAAVKAFRGLFDAVLAGMEWMLKGLGKLPGRLGAPFRAAAKSVEGFRDDAGKAMDKAARSIDGATDALRVLKAEAEKKKRARLEVESEDALRRLREAKASLKDPTLTKTRRAEIKADISNLERKLRAARAALDKVKGKTVTVDVKVTLRTLRELEQSGRTGGAGGNGGTAGLMGLTRGVGSRGARFGQWGPRWSWNRNPRTGMGQHDGADISAPYGTAVWAPSGFRYAGRKTGSWHGNAVVMTRGSDRLTLAHLSRFAGTSGLVGYVGSTGNSSGPHLHAQLTRSGRYIDPAVYLERGGIIRRRPGGTLAVIGEGRHDEAVVPLPRGSQSLGGELHVHFHGPIIGSREDLARYVTDAQREYRRKRGGVPLGLG